MGSCSNHDPVWTLKRQLTIIGFGFGRPQKSRRLTLSVLLDRKREITLHANNCCVIFAARLVGQSKALILDLNVCLLCFLANCCHADVLFAPNSTRHNTAGHDDTELHLCDFELMCDSSRLIVVYLPRSSSIQFGQGLYDRIE